MSALSLNETENTSYNNVQWGNLTDQVTNGGDLPIFYSLEYNCDPEFYIWTALNTNDDTTLINNYTHYPASPLTSRAFYRVRATNNVGKSDFYSPVFMVDVGSNYSAGVCDINPSNVTICWSECSTQWVVVPLPTFYQLEWLNPMSAVNPPAANPPAGNPPDNSTGGGDPPGGGGGSGSERSDECPDGDFNGVEDGCGEIGQNPNGGDSRRRLQAVTYIGGGL